MIPKEAVNLKNPLFSLKCHIDNSLEDGANKDLFIYFIEEIEEILKGYGYKEDNNYYFTKN